MGHGRRARPAGDDPCCRPGGLLRPALDAKERWDELHAHPDWQFPSPPFPAFLSIMRGLANLVARHPGTDFIGAHVGCYAENLAWVGELLERCPNFYIDISARIGELGRQPYTARRFFPQVRRPHPVRHRRRCRLEYLPAVLPLLETDDEYFSHDDALRRARAAGISTAWRCPTLCSKRCTSATPSA
ncbi:MAG: amidohydrolase family protein [Kouleothrix sp.]